MSTKAGARAVADAILAETDAIDVLLDNAGRSSPSISATADGQYGAAKQALVMLTSSRRDATRTTA